MEKNNKMLYVLLGVFITLAVVFGGYIVYDKCIKSDKKEEDKKVELKEATKNEADRVFESFEKLVLFKKDLYKSDKYDIANISDKSLVSSAFKILNKDVEYCIYEKSQLPQPTSYDEINKALSKYVLDKKVTESTIKAFDAYDDEVFGTYYMITDDMFKEGFGRYIAILDKNGVIISGMCGGDILGPEDTNLIVSKFIKAEKDDNYFYIYEKQAFAKINSKDVEKIDYYKDYAHTQLVESGIKMPESLIGAYDESEIAKESRPDFEKYNTYKYTFKLVEGSYYFQSLELVK